MRRRDLIRHLESHDCVLIREGHSHSIYENPSNGHRSPVPRHREVPDPLAPAIFLPRSLKDWQEDDWQENDLEQSLRDTATHWNVTLTPKTLGSRTCTAP